MAHDDRTLRIHRKTPESAAMTANVKRAMALTARLNRLTFDDADAVRALFSELTGQPVDAGFMLMPPTHPRVIPRWIAPRAPGCPPPGYRAARPG